jgi:hypothetical protein
MTTYSDINPAGTTRTSKRGIARHSPLLPNYFNHQWVEDYITDFLQKNIMENNGVISGCVISKNGADKISTTSGEIYVNGNKVTVSTPGDYTITADGWYVTYVTSAGLVIHGYLENSTAQGPVTPDDAVIIGYSAFGNSVFNLYSFFNSVSEFSDVEDKTLHIQPDVTVGPSLSDTRVTDTEDTFIASLTAGDKLLFLSGVTLTGSRDVSSVGEVKLMMDGPSVQLNLDTFDLTLGECSGYVGLSSNGGKLILNGECHGLVINGSITVEKGANFSGSYFRNGDLVHKSNIIAPNTPGKNAIINPNFDIWQRGTSFVAVANDDYLTDRFRYTKIGAMVHTVTQDSDVPTQSESGFKSNYSMKVDCTTIDASIAAGDLCSIDQRIEGHNYKQFEGNIGTLSFWVKATKTGIYCVSFRNSGEDRSYVVEYTVNSSDTWEKKTITLDFDYSGGTWLYTNGIGLRVSWCLAAGTTYHGTADTWNSANNYATSNQVNACDNTSNNFFLSQVQFELGDTATDFEQRDFGQERIQCKRYYQHYSGDEDAAGVGLGTMVWYNGSTIGSVTLLFPVEMRAVPSLSLSSATAINCLVYNSNSKISTALAIDDAGRKGCAIDITTGSHGLTESAAGKAIILNGEWIAFSAEL